MVSKNVLSISNLVSGENELSSDQPEQVTAIFRSIFSFTEDLDIAMIHCVLSKKPWLSNHGDRKEAWIEVANMFYESTAYISHKSKYSSNKVPTEKTLHEHF